MPAHSGPPTTAPASHPRVGRRVLRDLAGAACLLLGTLSLLLGLEACGGESRAGASGARTSLAWGVDGPTEPLPESVRHPLRRSWVVGRSLPLEWQVPHPERWLHELDEGRFALRLHETLPLRVRGPLAPDFGRVVVRALAPQGGTLELQLVRDGKVVLRGGTLAVEPGAQAQDLVFEVPQARHEHEPFDQLVLRARSRKGAVSVLAMVLLGVPVDEGLPDAGEVDLVDVDGDRRAATTLRSDRPLKLSLLAGPRDVLEFDVGAPRGLLAQGRDLFVQVSLWPRDGDPEVRRFELSAASSVPWQTLRVECPARSSGTELEALVELGSDALEGVALAASPPRVLHGRDPRVLLLVTVDAWRADALASSPAATGGAPEAAPSAPRPDMPRLSARVDAGATLVHGRVTSDAAHPVTLSILTGQPCPDLGPAALGAELPPDVATLAERLRASGWSTALVTSDAEVGTGGGAQRGFERVLAPARGRRPDAVSVDLALRTLVDLGPVPRFLWLHLSDPCAPYEAEPRFTTRVAATRPDPERAGLEPLPEAARVPWRPGVRDPEWVRGQYRAELLALDDHLQQLLAHPALEGADWILCGTSGEGLGERELWWRHDRLEPELLEVPLVLDGPHLRGRAPAPGCGVAGIGRIALDALGLPALAFPDGSPRRFPGEGAQDVPLALAVDVEGRSALAWGTAAPARLALYEHRDPGRGRVLGHTFEVLDLEGGVWIGDDGLLARDPGARALRERMVRALARRGLPAPDPGCDCVRCVAAAHD